MTMVPPHHQQNISIQHNCNFSGGYVGGGYYFSDSYSEGLCVMRRLEGYDYSDLAVVASPMAAEEDESETTLNEQDKNKDEAWLQLSIGSTQNNKQNQVDDDHQHLSSRKGELIELNLLPSSSSSCCSKQESFLAGPRPLTTNITTTTPHFGYGTSSLLLGNTTSTTSSSFPRQEMNYIYRPMPLPQGPAVTFSSIPSSSSSSFMPRPGGAYFTRPFQLQGGGISMPGPDMDFRVINPPPRPNSGIWFMLQASQNQCKEPFLPQIPKSYLRIKDGRMTIRLVMKYIANKLSLESESQVEMTCRGQQLLPLLTLQHVRDNIWATSSTLRDAAGAAAAAAPSINDHLMVLHYGRTA